MKKHGSSALGIGTCTLILLAILTPPMIQRERAKTVEAKVERALRQQRDLVKGVLALFIDDCNGIGPEPNYAIPTRLTTPIAYTASEQFIDPFGDGREWMMFLPTYYYANTGAIAFLSRGPDGDLDGERLPPGKAWPRPLELPDGTSYTILSPNGGEGSYRVNLDPWNPRFTHFVHRWKNGEEWISNDTVAPPTMPPIRVGSDDFTATQLPWFAEHGVHLYDPTNGIISDGDVFVVLYY